MLSDRIKLIDEEIKRFTAEGAESIEKFRLKYLSRKGVMAELFEDLKKAAPEEKKKLGKVLNDLKQAVESRFKELSDGKEKESSSDAPELDLTLPPVPNKTG